MPCTLTGITANDCAVAKGGIEKIWVVAADSLTSVTVTSGQITNLTLAGTATLTQFVPTKNQTAYFNQTGERPNEFSVAHQFAQELFASFSGLSDSAITAAKQLKDCCRMVAIVKTGTGVKLAIGIELDTTATGGFVTSRDADCRATVNIFTDTSANDARVEVFIRARSTDPSPIVNMTDAALDAL